MATLRFDACSWSVHVGDQAAYLFLFPSYFMQPWVAYEELLMPLGMEAVGDALSAMSTTTEHLRAKYGAGHGPALDQALDHRVLPAALFLDLLQEAPNSRLAQDIVHLWRREIQVEFETTPEVARLAWCAMRDVMRAICRSDGLVFGGACRDYVFRMQHAHDFYAATTTSERARYGDPTFHPECAGRLLLPRDVDAVLDESMLNAFLQKVRNELRMQAVRVFRRLPRKYIPHWVSQAGVRAKWHRYKITWSPDNIEDLRRGLPRYWCVDPMAISSCKRGCFFNVDLMLMRREASIALAQCLPLMDCDFECNSLVLAGPHMEVQLMNPGDDSMPRILRDIERKRAVLKCWSYGRETKLRRVRLMTVKGWSVEGLACLRLASAGRQCTACVESHDSDVYEMKCCGRTYHAACLRTLQGACDCCSSEALREDLDIVDAIEDGKRERRHGAGDAGWCVV